MNPNEPTKEHVGIYWDFRVINLPDDAAYLDQEGRLRGILDVKNKRRGRRRRPAGGKQ